MNKILCCSLFLMAGVIACSESKYGIHHIYGFYQIILPGTIRVDTTGKPVKEEPNILYTIYIESSESEIEWTRAWINGKFYSINTALIKQFPFETGKRKADNEKILLTPASGNKLWELQLIPSYKSGKNSIKAKENKIILEGNFKGKKVIRKIKVLTELLGPLSVKIINYEDRSI